MKEWAECGKIRGEIWERFMLLGQNIGLKKLWLMPTNLHPFYY
jgi:hypothetical protein